MSVLNNEDLDRQQKREVEVVQQVKKDFEEGFNRGCTPVLLIDPQHEINVFQVAKDNNALYIDLSHRIDYPMLCRIVRFATSIEYDAVKSEYISFPQKVRETSSIIFDNIENIPDTESREDIQYLVKYALRKEEDVPTPDNTYFSFSNYKVGARCRQAPDYLYEGSKAYPIYCVVPQE